VVPVVDGAVVAALPDGEEKGADGGEMGAGSAGDDVGVVDVGVGSVGDVTAVELRFVVPVVEGPVVGALPDGEDTGGVPTGDDVGVVDVWVGSIGDATGVGAPEGAEVGCCGEAGVEVGLGGSGAGLAGTTSKRNASPLPSTAAHEEPEKHETAVRLPRRSSSVGVDHAEPL